MYRTLEYTPTLASKPSIDFSSMYVLLHPAVIKPCLYARYFRESKLIRESLLA